MNQQTEEMHLYFTRVRPMCRELFAMAFAICADYDAAELALQKVILGGFQSRRRYRSSKAFYESMRADMRRAALSCLTDTPGEWDRLGADPVEDASEDALLAAIRQERPGIRRVVMLKYGCALTGGQIARVTGLPAGQVDQIISRFLRRLKRRLDSEQRGKLDVRLKEICCEALGESGAEMPDIGALYRNFEAEASANYSPVSRVASRAAVFVAAIVLMVILSGIVWCVSAIVRPPQLESNGLMTETLIEQ